MSVSTWLKIAPQLSGVNVKPEITSGLFVMMPTGTVMKSEKVPSVGVTLQIASRVNVVVCVRAPRTVVGSPSIVECIVT